MLGILCSMFMYVCMYVSHIIYIYIIYIYPLRMDCISFSSSNLPFHFIRPNHMEVSQVMGMPPSYHPFFDRIFHERNHPAIEWGSPIYGPPHSYFVSQSLCIPSAPRTGPPRSAKVRFGALRVRFWVAKSLFN